MSEHQTVHNVQKDDIDNATMIASGAVTMFVFWALIYFVHGWFIYVDNQNVMAKIKRPAEYTQYKDEQTKKLSNIGGAMKSTVSSLKSASN